jgi:hypothetical protein
MRVSATIGVVFLLSLGSGAVLAQDNQPAEPQVTEPQVTQPQASPPQSDQQPSESRDPVADMVGAWELSNADHDKICKLNFRKDTAPNGYKLDLDKNCANVFPSTKDVVAWTIDKFGNLRLLDGSGDAALELSQVEGGMFDGFKPEEGRYVLQAAAAVQTRSADDMIGDWAIERGAGKPICLLTLANTPAPTGGDYLTITLKPGCDVLVTRFGPTAWRMDNSDLVLSSTRGQSWHFEENDLNTWQRVPGTPDPVLLIRQGG